MASTAMAVRSVPRVGSAAVGAVHAAGCGACSAVPCRAVGAVRPHLDEVIDGQVTQAGVHEHLSDGMPMRTQILTCGPLQGAA